MKKIAIGATLALLGLGAGGVALASHHAGGRHGPDADGNGSVSLAEMQEHGAQMFERFDVNKDGKLDPADREARHAARFDVMDTDKNGSISRAEFMAMREQRMGGRHGEGHGGHGMGGHGMGMRHGGRHGGMGMMMARMVDANNDGAVTRAEFDAALSRHFAEVDTDKNGQASAEERRAMHQRMRQMHRPAALSATPKSN